MSSNPLATATMQTSQPPPWAVYAKSLYSFRRGYPLWHPTIECGDGQHVGRDSGVGMVGVLEKGRFRPLLNAMEEFRNKFKIIVHEDSDPTSDIQSVNPTDDGVQSGSR